MAIFERDDAVGSFAGFAESGLEFHADVVVPYRLDLQSIPLHGHFILVQLADDSEAILGRITTVRAQGRLTSPIGEDFAVRQVLEDREIPDDLRERFLKYRIDLRVLGVLRERREALSFVPSHRRVPHVGAKVAFLSPRLLRFAVAADGGDGLQELGFFTLGEFVYAESDERLAIEDWMTVMGPSLPVHFPTRNLISRRSVVFARAGFGKSNLMKTLLAKTYEDPPTHPYVGRDVPVGTIVFDPEGEYFFPDNQGRPGLCDVPHLRDKLVVFTDRPAPPGGYEEFVASTVRLDLRDLGARETLSMVWPADVDSAHQTALARLSQAEWAGLFDARDQSYADLEAALGHVNGLANANQQAQRSAATRKIDQLWHELHDSASTLLRTLTAALQAGRLCVIDVSMMRGGAHYNLAGLLLKRFFEMNQRRFTDAEAVPVPIIAVIEEAQAVLAASLGESNPFIEWTKEGRKYGLGSILVTQQPGAIQDELISQADNFFVFHLLSEGDLKKLKAANAHFSDDLLSSLLNEPIPGNGVVWSSASQRQYPIAMRTLDFAATYPTKLPEHSQDAPETWVATAAPTPGEGRAELKGVVDAAVEAARAALMAGDPGVKVARLAGQVKAAVVSATPEGFPSDREALFAAMGEVKASAKRLAPEGYVLKTGKRDDGGTPREFMWWVSEA